jgi:hypothetical protein
MRLFIIVIAVCGLAIALFTPRVTPMKPDPRLPTFQPVSNFGR